MRVEKNTKSLCYSCSKDSIIEIFYTKYGASIVLCKECIDEMYGQYLLATFDSIAENIFNNADWSEHIP